jgi:predicted flap endonuclease-1-like 5' DNA nuclease
MQAGRAVGNPWRLSPHGYPIVEFFISVFGDTYEVDGIAQTLNQSAQIYTTTQLYEEFTGHSDGGAFRKYLIELGVDPRHAGQIQFAMEGRQRWTPPHTEAIVRSPSRQMRDDLNRSGSLKKKATREDARRWLNKYDDYDAAIAALNDELRFGMLDDGLIDITGIGEDTVVVLRRNGITSAQKLQDVFEAMGSTNAKRKDKMIRWLSGLQDYDGSIRIISPNATKIANDLARRSPDVPRRPVRRDLELIDIDGIGETYAKLLNRRASIRTVKDLLEEYRGQSRYSFKQTLIGWGIKAQFADKIINHLDRL